MTGNRYGRMALRLRGCGRSLLALSFGYAFA